MHQHDPLLSPLFLAGMGRSWPKRLLLEALWQEPLPWEQFPLTDSGLLALRRQERFEQALTLPANALTMLGRLDPLVRVMQMAHTLGMASQQATPLLMQVHDEQPAQVEALRLDAPAAAARPEQGVIPDPYCLGSRGYLLFRQAYAATPPPPWAQRRSLAIWRGTTTGSRAITPRRLPQNPRYRLCRHSLRCPGRLDARFSSVVQCRDEEAQRAVAAQLQSEGLMATVLEPLEMAQCRWIVDIDGNVNSWGLLWKLLSGSCVLRVISERGQWFHHRLQPWHHLVPIRADLADLEQQLDWCFSNPAACAAIADAGQRLALEVLEDLGVDLLSALRWSFG